MARAPGIGREAARRLVAAACLAALAFAGGSTGTVTGAGPTGSALLGSASLAYRGASPELVAGLFSPKSLASMTSAEIEEATRSLAAAARGSARELEEIAGAFPLGKGVLAFLALDRDVDDFVEASSSSGPAGSHYREVARLAAELRPLRGAYETLYSAAYEALRDPGAASGAPRPAGRKPLSDPGDLCRPDRRQFPYSHTYALDVFFKKGSVARRGSAETGPRILSLSPGIVVASAADWRGGAGISAWKGGGLSPAAGNGVVVYAPSSRRYYSYFHLSEVEARVGQLVAVGDELGLGGNTGMNARRPGHGEHVHVEVFDAAAGKALRDEQILALLEF